MVRAPCHPCKTAPLSVTPNLAIPDSNKEEQCPSDTIEGRVGQEESGVETGSPQQVLREDQGSAEWPPWVRGTGRQEEGLGSFSSLSFASGLWPGRWPSLGFCFCD